MDASHDGKSGFPAQDPARRAEQAEFLARISHEIRTPLNAIIGYAEMLEKTTLDEKQQHYTANIVKGGLSLVEILNQWLKQARGADAEDETDVAPAPQTAVQATPDAPFTLLVVEDSPLICDLFSDIFNGGDSRVLTAANGREALQLAAADLPHLVFIDLHLADIDGWTLARQLRDNPQTAHIPRIVMTGQVLRADEYKQDFVDFLQKPFQLKQLREMVGRWREQGARPEAAPAPPDTKTADTANLAELVRPYWTEAMSQLLTAVIHTGSLPLATELGETLASLGENNHCDTLRAAGLQLTRSAALPDIAGMDALIGQLAPLLEKT